MTITEGKTFLPAGLSLVPQSRFLINLSNPSLFMCLFHSVHAWISKGPLCSAHLLSDIVIHSDGDMSHSVNYVYTSIFVHYSGFHITSEFVPIHFLRFESMSGLFDCFFLSMRKHRFWNIWLTVVISPHNPVEPNVSLAQSRILMRLGWKWNKWVVVTQAGMVKKNPILSTMRQLSVSWFYDESIQ